MAESVADITVLTLPDGNYAIDASTSKSGQINLIRHGIPIELTGDERTAENQSMEACHAADNSSGEGTVTGEIANYGLRG